MRDELVAELLDQTAAAIRVSLGDLDDWGPAGTRPGQYRSDLAADEAGLSVLTEAGVAVLSEESGLHRAAGGLGQPAGEGLTVVMDPLDGSTNASRGVPWFGTSLCAVDADGPRVALVINLVSADRFEAVRGGGARRNGEVIRPSDCRRLDQAVLGLSGFPDRHLGWRQYRALGAAALDLCAVACGALDGYVDCSVDAHGSWDYLGGMLVCLEAGASVIDAHGRDLVTLDHAARRTPLAAATTDLLEELRAVRSPD